MLRHYSDAAAAMRQHMRTMQAHYMANEAAFRAFNPEFDADFGPQWLAAIGLADTTPDHSTRVGELKEDTDAVENVMEQARRAVQTVFYYVGRAFPKNVGRLTTYGRNTYEAARDNHDKMRTLLQTAFTSATRDQKELAAKGYSDAQLSGLGTLVAQLAATNTTQEVQKGTNEENTAHYLTIQNLAYGYGQEVSGASKVLYAENKARRDLFRLSGPAASGRESHELTTEPGAYATATFATPLLATTGLRLRLTGAEAGQSATVGRVLAAGNKLAAFVTLSADITEMDVLPPALGPAGQVLVAQSNGEYAVRVEMEVLG